MRARARITDMTATQWDRLHTRVSAEYDIPPGSPRICAEFENGAEVRHVEMPVIEFATVVLELSLVLGPVELNDGPKGVADAAVVAQSYIPGQGDGAGWNNW